MTWQGEKGKKGNGGKHQISCVHFIKENNLKVIQPPSLKLDIGQV